MQNLPIQHQRNLLGNEDKIIFPTGKIDVYDLMSIDVDALQAISETVLNSRM